PMRIFDLRVWLLLLSGGGLHLRLDHEHVRVMYDLAIAWPQFSCNYPFILGEVSRHLYIGVLVGTGRRQRVRRNRDDHVGLADLPTVRKRWSRRHVLRIAFELGAIRPGFDGLHF